MASPMSAKKGPPAATPNLIMGMTFGSFIAIFVFIYALMMRYYPGDVVQDASNVTETFLLLLPDYTVALMIKIFTFSFILSLLLIFIIIWAANSLIRIRRQMHEALLLSKDMEVKKSGSIEAISNEKWKKVVTHINSENPSDWKLAILECDIMLGDILTKMGYTQESIGEQLKSIEPSDFTNIEAAWEAHKIRNQIAHEGSEYLINEREAKRVIGLYELVFREFEYI